MTFLHYAIVFIIILIFTGILRFLQLQNQIWVELYVFVFAPLMVLSLLCLLLVFIQIKAAVFLEIGRFLFIYSILGVILGYCWQLIIKRH
ncbi:hypothetical protein ACFFJI_04195 [Allobacillus sp. GCM10007491]|uniref:YesK-like protein n=2 Tax=Allobacillus TaxID=1400133 RepID=A0A941HSQ1_9BACI|nr:MULTISPECIES: hypothetical protein [Allobacillus]MBR7553976.1 hypothetical protein [Allobacillus saliphilus]TSJ60063.1 hypothetical protein FPQ13_12380 [Allobacillus salarius]